MLINLYALINEATGKDQKDHGDEDVIRFKNLQSNIVVHGIVFEISRISFLRAICSFNERETKALLSAFVALPMTAITALFRIMILAIIVTYAGLVWFAILLIR